MPTPIFKALEALVAERSAVEAKEQQLVAGLKPILATLGYDLVRAGDHGKASASSQASRQPRAAAAPPLQALPCPQCSRTFARPLHLGRHMKAAHKRMEVTGEKPAPTPTGPAVAQKKPAAQVTKKGRRMSPTARKAAARSR